MANERWNLLDTTEFTAEPGTATGLVNPPLTVAQRLAGRPSNYGNPIVPPAPVPYTDVNGNPVPGGKVTATSIQLFWKSGVGTIAKGTKTPPLTGAPDPSNLGSAGLNSIGVSGHNIYLNGGAQPYKVVRGTKLNTIVSGLTPSTTYTLQIEAIDLTGAPTGNKSAVITVTTPAADSSTLTLAPNPPGGFSISAPLPVINTAAGGPITVTWNRVNGVTSYEIWDNNTPANTIGMDPARPGLMTGDTLIKTVAQPSGTAAQITTTTPNYTVPGQTFRLKIRSVYTGTNGTAYSAFSPALVGELPEPTVVPGTPAAPTLFQSPIVGGQVKLTITEPTVDSTHGAPELYTVYDGAKTIAALSAPLGAAPQVTVTYAPNQTYSFTVVAANDVGVSAASPALAGTVPPAAPANVRLNGTVTTTTVPVQWDTVTGATSYNVYDGATLKTNVTAPTTSVTISGYTTGTPYSLTVTAVNAGGESAHSTALTGSTA